MDSREIEKELYIHPEVLDMVYQLKARHLLPVIIRNLGEDRGLVKVKMTFLDEDELLYQWLIDKASNNRINADDV